MQLYLLRHGIAEDNAPGGSDADRALTSEGRRKLRHVLETASRAEVEPTLILSSPLKRAIQTAEIVQNVLHYRGEILRTRALTPDATVEPVWDEIRVHHDQPALLLVGHNPLFSYLAAYLLGSKELQIDFKKGALLCIDLQSFGRRPKGILCWHLIPKLAAVSD